MESKYLVYRVLTDIKGCTSVELSSHTIFGALCWALKSLSGEESLNSFLKEVKEGNFLLSSFMPLVNGEELVFRPLLKPALLNEIFEKWEIKDETEQRNLIKAIKRLPFIPFSIFKEVAEGKIKSDDSLAEEIFKKFSEEENAESVSEGIKKYLKNMRELSSDSVIPHAKINRITGSTSYGGEFFFEESKIFEGNFYFLIAVSSEEFLNDYIGPSLRLIEDWGIGGNRSVGSGNVKFRKIERAQNFEDLINRKSSKFVTLSPVIATTKINYEESYYDLKAFKGAIESGYLPFVWKPKFFYLKEGSVIKLKKNKDFAGTLFKPFEDKNLYHYGLEFPIYIQEKENEG